MRATDIAEAGVQLVSVSVAATAGASFTGAKWIVLVVEVLRLPSDTLTVSVRETVLFKAPR
ncbi:hypothetical protein GCM10023213_48910 [Prosthecobacter algae]|uniref:Uncharacterized protein n=1 Tax=Prosthecobacter algae TaxID=1144682 RepID=A0ABP9PQ10_9BACT